MIYDFSKLRGRIVEVCGTRADFAAKIGRSTRTVSLKLNNKRPWTQNEIEKAVDVLHLTADEIQSYFFTKQVR